MAAKRGHLDNRWTWGGGRWGVGWEESARRPCVIRALLAWAGSLCVLDACALHTGVNVDTRERASGQHHQSTCCVGKVHGVHTRPDTVRRAAWVCASSGVCTARGPAPCACTMCVCQCDVLHTSVLSVPVPSVRACYGHAQALHVGCALHAFSQVHSGCPGGDAGPWARALRVCVSMGGPAVSQAAGAPGPCPRLCVQARVCTWLLEEERLKMELSAPS